MLLQPMSDSEVEEMMAEMHSDDLRAAYGEMLAGCRREPENRIWYAPWKMTLKNSREYMGVKSDFLFAESLEEAHLMVVSGRGFMPVEFIGKPRQMENMVGYVPVFQNGKQLQRQYYAFWRADTVKDYVEDFAALLEQSFLTEK